MALADPERSRAVLIGTSRFTDPELPDLPAVRNNLDGLAACLHDPALWGLPEAHCRVVADPDSVVALVDPIHEAAADAEDTLLIYYAGHGLVHPRTLELLLTLVGSSPGRTYTAVAYDEVRHHVIDSRAARKVVILDCCYSGRATGGMSDPTSAVANEAVIEGTYLLASAPPNKQSLSPPGETYTAFTGALLKILTEGLHNGPELLQLDAIFRHVRDTLKRASRPEPQLRVDNTAGQLALVRNAWHRASDSPPKVDSKRVVVDAQAWAHLHREANRLPLDSRRSLPGQAHGLFGRMIGKMANAPVRERLKELVDDAGATGWYDCPVCGVPVVGADLTRHVDEHRSDEIGDLDPATLTLVECRQDLLDGRYRLGALIGGQKGLSEMRIATDLQTDRTVMVRMWPLLERIARAQERRTAVAFDHPGIARIVESQTGYVVLEHIDGRSLSEVIRSDGPMPSRTARQVMLDVCDALSYAHERGVSHGELGSHNVLLTRDGDVKVLFFGTHKPSGDTASDRSDIYSAGELLSELLTGDAQPTLHSQLVLPKALRPIIDKAMDGNPARRYQSAAEMRDALRRAR